MPRVIMGMGNMEQLIVRFFPQLEVIKVMQSEYHLLIWKIMEI